MEGKTLAIVIVLFAAIALGAGKCDDDNSSSGGSCEPIQYAASAA